MFTGLEKKKFSPDATKMGGIIVDLFFSFHLFVCLIFLSKCFIWILKIEITKNFHVRKT